MSYGHPEPRDDFIIVGLQTSPWFHPGWSSYRTTDSTTQARLYRNLCVVHCVDRSIQSRITCKGSVRPELSTQCDAVVTPGIS